MEVRNKDLKNRRDAEQNAIRIIKECGKNNKGFILYTSGKEDIISTKASELPGIVGSLFVNLMNINNENSTSGLSKKQIMQLLDYAEEYLDNNKKSKNSVKDLTKNFESMTEDFKSVNECLEKIIDCLDTLNKIDNK